jgi:hypothetical protein
MNDVVQRGLALPWKWSRPYKNHSGKTQLKIVDATGKCIISGYCKSDEDAETIVRSVNFRADQAAQPQVSDGLIREIFLANGFTIKDGLSDLKPYVFAAARALLDRAFQLPAQSVQVPEEWKLMPPEATDEMVDEGALIQGGYDTVNLRELYKAMFTSAPQPDQGGDK